MADQATRPKSLPELLKVPGALDAWTTLDASAKNGILTMLEQEASGSKIPLTPKALETYYALSTLSATDPDKFSNINLAKKEYSEIPREYLHKLMELQRVGFSNEARDMQKAARANTALKTLTPMLLAADIDTTPKEGSADARKLDAFRGAVVESVEQFVTDHKRAPTDAEIRSIGSALLSTGSFSTDHYWFFPGQKHAFEGPAEAFTSDMEIPADRATAIEAGFKKKYGRAPTEAELRKTYTDFLIFKGSGRGR